MGASALQLVPVTSRRHRKTALAYVFVVVIVTGCGGSDTQAVRDISGVYGLTQVDGVALPVSWTATSSGSPCSSYLTDGQISLEPAFPDRGPLYGVSVFAGPACDPNQPADPATLVVNEGGRWSASGDQLQLMPNSGSLNSGRSFSNAQGRFVDLTGGGHVYTFRFAHSISAPAGTVTVSTMDQTGNDVPGVSLTFRTSEGLAARGVTTSGRSFSTSGPGAGSVRIWFMPPAGYSSAPGQSDPFDVTSAAGQQTVSVIHLLKN